VVNLSIFGMIVVDTWLVYKAFAAAGTKLATRDVVNQKGSYSWLLEELIENSYNEKG
jgi:hypothetical protein